MRVPPLAVVVLSWKEPTRAIRAAKSVLSAGIPPEACIIVENEAGKSSRGQSLREALPGCRVLEQEANLGYAGGMNAGLSLAEADGIPLVLLLNNDAVVRPDCLRELTDSARRHPEAALFGTSQLQSDGVIRPPTFWFQWSDGRVRMEETPAKHAEPFLAGCALLVRTSCLPRLGMLDDRYFLYCEDVELSMRARRLGLEVVPVPSAVVEHELSSSSGGAKSPIVAYYDTRNRFLLSALAPTARLGWRMRVEWTLRCLRQSVRKRQRKRSGVPRAIRRGLWDGWLGVTGRHLGYPAPLDEGGATS